MYKINFETPIHVHFIGIGRNQHDAVLQRFF